MIMKTAEVAAGLDDEMKLTTGYCLKFIDFISEVEQAKGKHISNVNPFIVAHLSEMPAGLNFILLKIH